MGDLFCNNNKTVYIPYLTFVLYFNASGMICICLVMVNQNNGISHINMSNADPLTEPLLCRVNGDGCHMIFFPLFEWWKCLILCSSSFYSFAKQLSGPKCALSSQCRPTHTSLPLPNHCITPVPPASHVSVKESRVRFPVQEQQLPLCHTPELSAHGLIWMHQPWLLPLQLLLSFSLCVSGWSVSLDEYGGPAGCLCCSAG